MLIFRFYCDSMFNDPTGRRLWGQMMVQAIRSRNYASMPTSKITSNYYYKNYRRKITTLALLGTTECLMEEEYISQDWKLADSTKIIHGYQCRLAECHFRGRNYHAWFAPEIPLNEGPWKFNGLPGLILEVYDTQDHYHFTLIGMQQEGTEPVCYYNFRPNYEKIDRIKYLKMSASRTHKGVDPEIKKVLNLDKMTPKTKKCARTNDSL
ncbi:MAG: GLPGLI family protein [Phocaeicola vulgatus]